MVAPLLPLLSEQFGTTTRHVSFIEPSYLLGYGLFTLVYAPLSDRFGRFRIITLCLVIFSVLTLLTAYAHGINQMIFLRLLTGIGAAGIAPTTISWISDRYPYEKRGHALGIFFGNNGGWHSFRLQCRRFDHIASRMAMAFYWRCEHCAAYLAADCYL
ncbi:MFS transporter [Sphingobacterium siyangense]